MFGLIRRWLYLLGTLFAFLVLIVMLGQNGLPSLIDAGIMIGVVVLLSVLSLTFVHYVYPGATRPHGDNDVINGTFAIVGSIYALLVGFVVVVVWQTYSDTQATIAQETNAIVDIERMSRGFPVPIQRQVQEAARTYVRLVIDEEWGLMARGESSIRANAALVEIWSVYTDMEDRERISPLYDHSLTRLNELGDSRRLRLLASTDSIPMLMWVLLLTGAAATMATGSLFAVRSHKLHRVLIAVLSAVLVFSLYIIFALEGPFDDTLPITSDPFVNALLNMRQLET